MSLLKLSVACGYYDRTRALLDGKIPIEGVDIIPVALEPEEAFHRAFKFGEFDVTEISLSSHVMTTSRGEHQYVAIPAFVSRVFRHSGIFINKKKGIRSAADLRGKTIGVPEYQITANVWIRGILKDDFGLEPASCKWIRGGIEEPGRQERAPIKLPAAIDLTQAPADKTLSKMLAAGEIDAMITARAPSCYLDGHPDVDRLFPDKATEEEYFRRTKIFPIMHAIGIRKELVAQHPWLPVSLYKAFEASKAILPYWLRDQSALHVTLPWGWYEYERMVREFGADYWPYGFDANKHVLETFCRYHHDQGLSQRLVKPDELFAASTLDLSKI